MCLCLCISTSFRHCRSHRKVIMPPLHQTWEHCTNIQLIAHSGEESTSCWNHAVTANRQWGRCHVHLFKQLNARMNTVGMLSNHTAQEEDGVCVPETNVLWWLKVNKVNISGWPSQTPDLRLLGNLWGRAEKACVSKAACKPDSATQVLSGRRGQNSS